MNDKPLGRKDVLCKQLDETEAMLYDPETEDLHILNPTARLIWHLCDGEHAVEDMVTAIKAQCAGTEGSDVLSDVHRTLDVFAARGLLEFSS